VPRSVAVLLGVLTPLAWVAALWQALVVAPDDAVLGPSQRILYIHLGAAWTAALCLLANFVLSVLYLVRRRLAYDRWAGVCAEVGTILTTAVLATGMLWARVAWNTWWTWDPRLTTTAVMWFLYLGYLLVRQAAEGQERRALLSAVVGVVAFFDVPLVFLAIHWWRSIHPNIIGPNGLNMPPVMVSALMAFFAAFLLLAAWWIGLRAEQEELREAIARLAHGRPGGSL
jgi:heme exporter protein C